MYSPQVKYQVENEQEENLPGRINHVLKFYLSTEKVISLYLLMSCILHKRFFLNATQIAVDTIRLYSDITK
jgi:hypothetical protein